jgi:hypothetical protein
MTIRALEIGQRCDLEESIACQREALKLRQAPHPDRGGFLNNLAVELDIRFQQTSQLSDLEESVICYREALEFFPAPHPNRGDLLVKLAVALSSKQVNSLI